MKKNNILFIVIAELIFVSWYMRWSWDTSITNSVSWSKLIEKDWIYPSCKSPGGFGDTWSSILHEAQNQFAVANPPVLSLCNHGSEFKVEWRHGAVHSSLFAVLYLVQWSQNHLQFKPAPTCSKHKCKWCRNTTWSSWLRWPCMSPQSHMPFVCISSRKIRKVSFKTYFNLFTVSEKY